MNTYIQSSAIVRELRRQANRRRAAGMKWVCVTATFLLPLTVLPVDGRWGQDGSSQLTLSGWSVRQAQASQPNLFYREALTVRIPYRRTYSPQTVPDALLAIDAEGNLYFAYGIGVTKVSPNGKILLEGTVDTDNCTSFCKKWEAYDITISSGEIVWRAGDRTIFYDRETLNKNREIRGAARSVQPYKFGYSVTRFYGGNSPSGVLFDPSGTAIMWRDTSFEERVAIGKVVGGMIELISHMRAGRRVLAAVPDSKKGFWLLSADRNSNNWLLQKYEPDTTQASRAFVGGVRRETGYAGVEATLRSVWNALAEARDRIYEKCRSIKKDEFETGEQYERRRQSLCPDEVAMVRDEWVPIAPTTVLVTGIPVSLPEKYDVDKQTFLLSTSPIRWPQETRIEMVRTVSGSLSHALALGEGMRVETRAELATEQAREWRTAERELTANVEFSVSPLLLEPECTRIPVGQYPYVREITVCGKRPFKLILTPQKIIYRLRNKNVLAAEFLVAP